MEARFGEHIVQSGELFTYHLSFDDGEAGVAWRALVRNEAGALTARIGGIVQGVSADSPGIEELLRSEIAQAIDARDTRPPI